MLRRMNKKSCFLAITIVLIMLGSATIPSAIGQEKINNDGFDKGPSYKPVVPMKKVTMVNFDEETYLDDYAYLAAVPTCVFDNGEKLYSNPLLFYQDEYPVEEDKEKSLNARQGIDYFMEDWMGYCNGQMDQMTLINVPQNKLDNSWKAKEYTTIEGKDPYSIANDLALNEWSYSDNAVISVIDEEFERPNEKFTGNLKGTIPACDINEDNTFKFKQTNKLNPQYREFDVPEQYKYITARAWWASVDIHLKAAFCHILIPTGDKDIQLYCKHKDEWMQVAAGATCNIQSGMDADAERLKSYVYEAGKWMVGLTDLPTKGPVNKYGTLGERLSNLIGGVTYNVDIKMYPGKEIEIPDSIPFECTDVDFKLTWDNPSINLGFSLIGATGEEILSVVNESRDDNQELSLGELGQCIDGENYKLCVFVMDNINSPVDFEVEYSWKQRISKEEGDSLTSATEGAILASTLNAPLLYSSSSELSDETTEVLYKLGVKEIHLVDFGSNANDGVLKSLEKIAPISSHFIEVEDIYKAIQDKTGSNDIIFTTIDPWTYWYVTELQPAGEKEKALFIGPAAYIAAYHGSPVLIVDNHPELSSAVVWHNEFWKHYSNKRIGVLPTVAEMYITGMRIYEFLDNHNFDKEGAETIITVAGQYDIGTTWDRVFPGRANPGRIWGTPVDTSHIIARSMFYPALIFENPAMDSSGIKLINGSKSVRKFPWWGKLGLRITRESGEETYNYPILHTYVCYAHRLNEMFEKYYGTKYQFANEIIPGETNSFNPIDDGVNVKYGGEEGSFYPDLIDSELTPFYASRGGYDNAFSTSFEAVMHNLNQGSIMWIHDGHGLCSDSGQGLFWNVDNFPIPGAATVKEENPWRLYEWMLGSTEDPDTMTMEVHGIIPALLGNPNPIGPGLLRTGLAWAPAKKPMLDTLGSFPIIKWFMPKFIRDSEDYYDGMVNTVFPSTMNSDFNTGYEMDDALDNIHSCGYITANCLVANTYYHLTLIRHGSPYQIIDPWSTSWYSSAWIQSVPRDLALGDTIGEAYVNGISDLGILYISDPPQWWWDTGENVVYFGDPDLRPYVPGTKYSDANYWERDDVEPIRYDAELSVDGHMPFGATGHPNEKQPKTLLEEYSLVIVVLMTALVLVLVSIYLFRKRK